MHWLTVLAALIFVQAAAVLAQDPAGEGVAEAPVEAAAGEQHCLACSLRSCEERRVALNIPGMSTLLSTAAVWLDMAPAHFFARSNLCCCT
jgi:hypothetical protein